MRKFSLVRYIEIISLAFLLSVLFLGQDALGFNVDKGEKAKPISAEDTEGKKLTLDQYKGKLVLLDFWATWCPPCREEIPVIKALHKKYHKQGFEVIGVALDKEGETVTEFAKKHNMPWRQVLDGAQYKSKFSKEYGVRYIPTMILLGPDGKIIDTQARGERLKELIPKHIDSVTDKEPIMLPGHDSPDDFIETE